MRLDRRRIEQQVRQVRRQQYSGTAGRIENCQIGVFLAYKSEHCQALIDRRLYLPAEWDDDVEQRTGAKVPAEVDFATKPALARDMIGQALLAGVPARWVTVDAVYGGDSKFRRLREDRGLCYGGGRDEQSAAVARRAAGAGRWTRQAVAGRRLANALGRDQH